MSSSDLKRPSSPTSSSNPSKFAKMSSSLDAAPPKLLVKRLSDRATLPTRGSPFSAGLDLYSAEAKLIPARGKALIDTQLSLAIPYGTYGRVAPRSGLAAKHSLQTGAGVVDADYRGVLFVLLFNHGDTDFQVEKGDRVAQLILEKVEMSTVEEVETLDETVRGAGGFGSTGGFTAPAAVVPVAVTEAATVGAQV